MDNSNIKSNGHVSNFKDKHSFLLFIIISTLVSFIVVVISMFMYNSSGTAQLDLSRPGYVSVRSQAKTNSDDFHNFSSTGSIDKDNMNEFKTLYDKQSQRVKSVDAFGGDPLSPDALNISAPVE